jgi:hypothetical protein
VTIGVSGVKVRAVREVRGYPFIITFSLSKVPQPSENTVAARLVPRF